MSGKNSLAGHGGRDVGRGDGGWVGLVFVGKVKEVGDYEQRNDC